LVGSSGGSSYLASKGNYILRNNIFYSKTSGPVINSGSRTTFDHNCYYGITAPSDSNAVTDDPLFVDPGTGGSGVSEPVNSSLDGYKLTENSPCINAGTSISDNGGEDFFGNTLYNGCPDIGVHEFSDIDYPDCPDDSGSSTQYEAEDMILSNYVLNQNYPNPFNPSTKITYSIPKSDLVILKIYNVSGQEIQTLVNKY